MQHLNTYQVLNLEVSYSSVVLTYTQEDTVQFDVYTNNHLFPKAWFDILKSAKVLAVSREQKWHQ